MRQISPFRWREMARRPSDDADYYHARAIEEQVAAERATCAAARDRHDEMAAMYRFREVLARRRPHGWDEEVREDSRPVLEHA